MLIFKKIVSALLAILTGYDQLKVRFGYLEQAVTKSAEQTNDRFTYINHELDDLRRQSRKTAEDVAYIRGRLDNNG